MNKVMYFHEQSGDALQMAINKFAECHKILQISYCDVSSGHGCMVLYEYDMMRYLKEHNYELA